VTAFVGGFLRRAQARHLIWIVNSGTRKMDFYKNSVLSPNCARIAEESFVYEESYNETVSRHDPAFIELLTGGNVGLEWPNYTFLKDATGFSRLPDILRVSRPHAIVVRDTSTDIGHQKNAYFQYLEACKSTDRQIGRIFDFVKSDPYFCRTTTILIRPEFGRDDEATPDGELHHSTGYYQSHYSAEIWWGEVFRPGLDKSPRNRRDVASDVGKLLNATIKG